MLNSWKGARRKIAVVGATLVVTTGMFGPAAADILTNNRGHLAAAGPVSATDGFPAWYKDDSGLRLELCSDVNDPMCVPADLPDPTAPQSFPDNWPDETFYQLAGASLDIAGGGRATAGFDLEAAFAQGDVVPGDQMVFGRVRFTISGLQIGGKYKITHPYGVDEFVAAADGKGAGEIRYTQDIGTVPGSFGEALNSRIGPFLRWDPAVAPAAPVGYIGDPNVSHPVVGSPHNTNFLKIEGPGIGAPGAANLCDPAAVNATSCVMTRDFTLQGKLATNGGVEVERATYSRSVDGSSRLDVFATSDNGSQSIEVSGTGFDPTRLRGENGRYLAHIDLKGALPLDVTVTNMSDTPRAIKKARVTDGVDASAVYDADSSTLIVNASSTDHLGNHVLTVDGFGAIPAAGSLSIGNLSAPPARITVTSAGGGGITVPVVVTGTGYPAIPVAAFAGTDQQVLMGTNVVLDGSASTGPVTGYSWKQTAGPVVEIVGAATATPSFTAPAVTDTPVTLTFELSVEGAGGPAVNSVDVLVLASAPQPVANAGSDVTVTQGSTVKLDGSASADATSFSWKQVAGPTVSMTGSATATPSFVFPKLSTTLTFELTTKGPGGTATDTVSVNSAANVVTVGAAEYRGRDREWRISGTSNVFGPGVSVKIHAGSTTAAPVVGTASVDVTGAWTFRSTGSSVAPDATRRITVASSSGGTVTAAVAVR